MLYLLGIKHHLRLNGDGSRPKCSWHGGVDAGGDTDGELGRERVGVLEGDGLAAEQWLAVVVEAVVMALVDGDVLCGCAPLVHPALPYWASCSSTASSDSWRAEDLAGQWRWHGHEHGHGGGDGAECRV